MAYVCTHTRTSVLLYIVIVVLKFCWFIIHWAGAEYAICNSACVEHGYGEFFQAGVCDLWLPLPQGGLEVPCILIFSGESMLIDKTRSCLNNITKEENDKTKVSEAEVSMPPGKT